MSFELVFPWRTYRQMILSSLLTEKMCHEALDIERSHGEKGLSVNAGKTKVMICGTGLDFLQTSCEYPCAVCHTGVGNNSIFCIGCKLWVHKKCNRLKRLTPILIIGVHGKYPY